MRADRRLYVDRDWSRLVAGASPEAAFLLAAPGHEIPADMVTRLELVQHEGRVVQASDLPVPAPEPEPEPVEPEPEPEAAAPIMPPQSRRSRRKY